MLVCLIESIIVKNASGINFICIMIYCLYDMGSLSDLWSTKKVGGGIVVVFFIFMLFMGLMLAPSFVFESPSADIKEYDSMPLFSDDLTEVSFDSDVRVEQWQRFQVGEDVGGPAHPTSLLKYDEDAKRVSIQYDYDYKESYHGGGSTIVIREYFEFDEEVGEYRGYNIIKRYNHSESSWMDVSDDWGGSEEDGCLLNDNTVYVYPETDLDERERFIGGVHMDTGYQAEVIMPLVVNESGDTRTITVEEGIVGQEYTMGGFKYTDGRRGGFTQITESEGSIVREKVTSDSGEVFYEVTEADLQAEGNYHPGSAKYPLTIVWDPHKVVWEYNTSISHSDVTVDRPEVVEMYEQQC